MANKNFTMKSHNGTSWDTLHPKTNMEQVEGLDTKISEVEAIAKGASKAKVFDTVAELDTWLAVAANKASLSIGDNLYIKAKDVPDYWWDGASKQELETQKVALNLASALEDGLMAKGDKSKLDGIAANANNYTHLTGDGNSHIPATGTGNNTKVLKAGATANSAAWGQVLFSEVGSKPTTLSGYGITDAATAAQGAKADAALQAVPFEDTAGNIKINGTGAAGTSTKAARADHVHPVDTGREAAFTKGTAFNKNFEATVGNLKAPGTAAVGTSENIARADHVHPAQASVTGSAGTAATLTTARTIGIGTGATGTATSFNGGANIIIPITAINADYLTSGTVPAARLGVPVVTVSASEPGSPKAGDIWYDFNNI